MPINPANFLIAIFLFIAFSQLLTVFRIAIIFNSDYISLPIQLALILIFIWLFLARQNTFRITKLELILMSYPLLMIPWGIANNTLDRHTFSEPILIALFFFTIVVFRSTKVNHKVWRFGALIMMYALALFLILVFILNSMGIVIFSVAKTSIYFIYPTLFFLFFKESKKTKFSLLLVILSTKRSLLLSLPITYFIYFFASSKFKYQTKFYLGLLLSILFVGSLFFFSNSKYADYFPGHLNALYYKMALINPFSDIYNMSGDYRSLEITHSLEQSMLSFENYFFGKGPGFTYNVYDENGSLWFENVHNTHFTYASILSKYGLIYLFLLLLYFFKVLAEGIGAMRIYKDPIVAVFVCYFLCSFIETLTSYSLFINILNAAVIGQMSYIARMNNRELSAENRLKTIDT